LVPPPNNQGADLVLAASDASDTKFHLPDNLLLKSALKLAPFSYRSTPSRAYYLQ
jgi:hypothetical protein